jgi:hypothetical protein
VVSGKIFACQWTIKACQRKIEDLESAKSESFPYKFDKDKASCICKCIELLPHIKGEWAKNSARSGILATLTRLQAGDFSCLSQLAPRGQV